MSNDEIALIHNFFIDSPSVDAGYVLVVTFRNCRVGGKRNEDDGGLQNIHVQLYILFFYICPLYKVKFKQ